MYDSHLGLALTPLYRAQKRYTVVTLTRCNRDPILYGVGNLSCLACELPMAAWGGMRVGLHTCHIGTWIMAARESTDVLNLLWPCSVHVGGRQDQERERERAHMHRAEKARVEFALVV